jgi:hypothetical protein
MRKSLTAIQWARLRAYVNGLDQKGREDLKHRLLHWRSAVAKELSNITDGNEPKDRSRSKPLSDYLCEQVLTWLRKIYLAECAKK